MPIREDQLNGRIATIIRECTAGAGWTITEETEGTLASSTRRPDILITRRHPEPPIVLENEYHIGNIRDDCLRKLGQTLKPELGGQTVATVVGIHSPNLLQTPPTATTPKPCCATAPICGTPSIRERTDDYAASPKPASSRARSATWWSSSGPPPTRRPHPPGVRNPSNGRRHCRQCPAHPPGQRPDRPQNRRKTASAWPTGNTGDPRQARADSDACSQTANMAATIIINALAYQQNLDGHNGIKGLAAVRAQTASGRLTKDAVIAEFDRILDINYWPIFHVARELLLQIPAPVAGPMLDQMAETANDILDAIRHNDIAGTVFQRLIADRKTLKTYYTTPEATTLMAHLAIPEDLDWSDPETLHRYRIRRLRLR